MNNLATGTLLQNGKYEIVKTLGSGGFGITYLAIQRGLDREVVIKEFFMKEFYERSVDSNRITVGTEASRDIVNRFKEKFLKEARNLAKLNHPNIISVFDVFEENDTAYYVMEYAANGSLAEKIKSEGPLSEADAKRYILKVADALDYIHQRKLNHLDVKPANIVLNEGDEPILIDFGLSKQYDAVSGNQTSTTPVGISEGYAPMEQYKQGGVGQFSPETDIYALGATFFKLLTGITPPSAMELFEERLPIDVLKSRGVSQHVIDVICRAMESRKKDRHHDVLSFIDSLNTGTRAKVRQSRRKTTKVTVNSSEVASAVAIALDLYLNNGSFSNIVKEPVSKVKDDEATATLTSSSEKKTSTPLICKAMAARKRDRMMSISSFKGSLSAPNLETTTRDARDDNDESTIVSTTTKNSNGGRKWLVCLLSLPAIITLSVLLINWNKASYSNGTLKIKGVKYDFAEVKAGTFTMGANIETSWDDEGPEHEVTLTNDFYIGKTEVTQALWIAVMGKSLFRDIKWMKKVLKRDNKPFAFADKDNCEEFISKLNQMTGMNFRLPTEAEWEYAAKGGNLSRHYVYSGSDQLYEVGWYSDNSGYTGESLSAIHDVAMKRPNELGLYDMSGNVMELCSNYRLGKYDGNSHVNPTSLQYGYRGGSIHFSPAACRTTSRNSHLMPATKPGDWPSLTEDSVSAGYGFRLVVSK